jgi:hypothetical protein
MPTLIDPNTVLYRLSELELPAAQESSLIRVIRGLPSAVSSWERAVDSYLNRSISLDYVNNTDNEDKGWMYQPMLQWPAKNSRFIADVLAAIAEFEGTITLPTAYNEIKSACETFVTNMYPNGSDYYMFENYNGTDAARTKIVSDTEDAEVHPDTYEDDDAIGAGSVSDNAYARNVIRKVNNLIFHLSEDDSEVDLESASTIPIALSYPVAFVYLVISFLRTEFSATFRSGNFVSDAQWASLSSAGEAVLTN